MSTLTVTLGPQATFSLADFLQGFEGTIDEVIVISQATGEEQRILGLDKAGEAPQGLTGADVSRTTDNKPMVIKQPTADLFVSTIPGAVETYKAQQAINAERETGGEARIEE